MLRLTFLALVLATVSACSQFRGLAEEQQLRQRWAEQQQGLAKINNWDLRARAALKLEGEAYNIGIRWQQGDQDFRMRLEAPFGQGVFRIESENGGRYRLRLPDGQVFENNTAEALLEDVIGWSLPIGGLEYWIRGLPRPGSDYSHRLDARGRLHSVTQDSWSIDYIDYFAQPETPQLPRRIKLSNDTLTLKLIIEHWQQVELDEAPSDLFPEFN